MDTSNARLETLVIKSFFSTLRSRLMAHTMEAKNTAHSTATSIKGSQFFILAKILPAFSIIVLQE